MNVREGIRRLGILLGTLGGIVGAVLAYSSVGALWSDLNSHRRFESVMALRSIQGTVQELKKDRWLRYMVSSGGDWELLRFA